MRRHRLGMICIIVVLTLIFVGCPKPKETATTDTSGTAVSDTSMTVPPPVPVQKVEATPEAVKEAQDLAQKLADRDRRMHQILSFLADKSKEGRSDKYTSQEVSEHGSKTELFGNRYHYYSRSQVYHGLEQKIFLIHI